MNKNPHTEKPHKDQRDILVMGFQNYKWEDDPLKLKPIREAAEILPDSKFEEPNFSAIKTATSRTMSLIETLVQSQDYARCDSLKKMILRMENSVRDYCQNP
jgi:hypothetical protein